MIVYAPCPVGYTWTHGTISRWLIGEWNYQCIARSPIDCMQITVESNNHRRTGTQATHSAMPFKLTRES